MDNTAKSIIVFSIIVASLFLKFSIAKASANEPLQDSFGGRDLLVYVPSVLPSPGARALVVVLHGGLGNAQRIAYGRSETGLNMNNIAEKDGFLVVYLNGTPLTRWLKINALGWNDGGGCCGVPYEKNVDDLKYIQDTVDYIARKYGVDQHRIFGMGHSNGAMMTQRLMCESNLYSAAVCISGPLNLKTRLCPAARGKRILSIHGEEDHTVPFAGGRGLNGLAKAVYNSEQLSQKVFTDSGAQYTLEIVKGAGHKLENIDAAIQKLEGRTISEKAAAFFGLLKENSERPLSNN